jgi:hypothetical protein
MKTTTGIEDTTPVKGGNVALRRCYGAVTVSRYPDS